MVTKRKITFSELEAALAKPTHSPGSGARLTVSEAPDPFVPPTLLHVGVDSSDPLAAEVLFVEASAAVGKSTLARKLSASTRIPMLNLAEVPVSTGSLKSLVSDLTGGPDPIRAFHAGSLPIIIDALDEGRLLSNETGFESFLETSGEFLLQDRSVIDRPKLIICGRHESVSDAEIGLQLGGDGIITRTLEVGSFAEAEARQLIDSYARSVAKPNASYLKNPKPVQELVDAYFRAIEAALGLNPGVLWSDERGGAFAGYAPVLAALGSLLGKTDNFPEVTNRLRTEGAHEAWTVIETVLEEILKRERGKFCETLAKRISAPVPVEAYDAREQLTLLAGRIHGAPAGDSGRVELSSKDLQTYHSMVEQSLSDHPFIRQNEPSSAVLGSVILAHAIGHDLLRNQDSRFLPALSRQPFLWRSLRRQLETRPAPIDGSHVGYVLNSFWNDPMPRDHGVVVRSNVDGAVRVFTKRQGDDKPLFDAVPPISLFAQVHDCDVDVSAKVALMGHGTTGASSLFMMHGTNRIVCGALEVRADTMILDGEVWLEAESVESPPRLKLITKSGARVGLGTALKTTFPWSQVRSTLPAPYGGGPDNVVADLIAECARRLPEGGVLTLTLGFGVPDDVRMRWASREFPAAFPQLIAAMKDAELVSIDDSVSAHGERKIRVHFNVAWEDLQRALNEPTWNPRLQTFLREARQRITAR